MRILALETSGTRGSVALVSGSTARGAEVVARRFHDAPNQHAELLIGLIDKALHDAGWERGAIERVAVGVGPGSFTGIRVGLSLVQGLMLGLGVEGVGVDSLRAIAYAPSTVDTRLRIVVRDARRDEYFVAAYDSLGVCMVEPYTVAQSAAETHIAERFSAGSYVVLGTNLPSLPFEPSSEHADAGSIGCLAIELDPAIHLVAPNYVRGPNVTRPQLPVSPLSLPRTN